MYFSSLFNDLTKFSTSVIFSLTFCFCSSIKAFLASYKTFCAW
ncbi:conserved domain protein [Mycoplasmopsis alligatoris A21JP2]|uniref:Conserved domain protein n=1 Tax=Mycoplasmopsis alligatoris A21JP2 TaxID=747682 RepID=D4XWK0_9BACT|nr:conserved domain protein [Mycoplasmopsis alligatoris A21JP2]